MTDPTNDAAAAAAGTGANRGGSLRLDRAALAYVAAADAGDVDAMADLWAAAETDAELERVLCELNEGLLIEDGDARPAGDDRLAVLALIDRHFPARADPAPAPRPPTVGHVAARIAGDAAALARLSAADRATNEALLRSRLLLPDELGGRELLRLGDALGVTADLAYWRAFQEAAVLMHMASHRTSGRAAARPAAGPSGPRRTPPGKGRT